jgi:hypothetical protein
MELPKSNLSIEYSQLRYCRERSVGAQFFPDYLDILRRGVNAGYDEGRIAGDRFVSRKNQVDIMKTVRSSRKKRFAKNRSKSISRSALPLGLYHEPGVRASPLQLQSQVFLRQYGFAAESGLGWAKSSFCTPQ